MKTELDQAWLKSTAETRAISTAALRRVLSPLGAILFLVLLSTHGFAADTGTLDDQLLKACRDGDRAMVLNLVEKGANVNASSRRNRTPLGTAIENGHLGIVQLLVEKGANVNAMGDAGCTPLIMAVEAGDYEMFKWFLEKGADVNEGKRGWGTALMFAAGCCRIEMVKDLLDHGAEVNAMSGDCHTPLMSAAACGNLKGVRLLLDHGADPSVGDRDGRTALSHAERRMNNDVAKLLNEVGASGEFGREGARATRDKAKAYAACDKQLWETGTVTGRVVPSRSFLSIRPSQGDTDRVITLGGSDFVMMLPREPNEGDTVEVTYIIDNGEKVARIVQLIGPEARTREAKSSCATRVRMTWKRLFNRLHEKWSSYPDTPRGVIEAFLKESLGEPPITVEGEPFCSRILDTRKYFLMEEEGSTYSGEAVPDPGYEVALVRTTILYIATGFEITDVHQSNGRAKVTVLFRRFGGIDQRAFSNEYHRLFRITNDKLEIAYFLAKPAGSWRIVGDNAAYLSISSAIKFLKCQVETPYSKGGRVLSEYQQKEIDEGLRVLEKEQNK